MATPARNGPAPDESILISRAVAGDGAAIRAIVKHNNARLFRLARSMLRDDDEAEDAVQDTYLKAFHALASFRGEASLSTWLSRILLNECLQRLRGTHTRAQASVQLTEGTESKVIQFPHGPSEAPDPEQSMAQRELLRLVERAIDDLPDEFRLVLVARTMDEMSIEATADLLGLRPETVKTRLHRARKLLKASLQQQIEPLFQHVFPFLGRRCENMAERVLTSLGLQ